MGGDRKAAGTRRNDAGGARASSPTRLGPEPNMGNSPHAPLTTGTANGPTPACNKEAADATGPSAALEETWLLPSLQSELNSINAALALMGQDWVTAMKRLTEQQDELASQLKSRWDVLSTIRRNTMGRNQTSGARLRSKDVHPTLMYAEENMKVRKMPPAACPPGSIPAPYPALCLPPNPTPRVGTLRPRQCSSNLISGRPTFMHILVLMGAANSAYSRVPTTAMTCAC